MGGLHWEVWIEDNTTGVFFMNQVIIAILQARVSSSRLPSKVLRLLLGEPMIIRQIERESNISCIDKLVVATSKERSDDPLVELLENRGIEVFRGSLNDVLDRYYNVAIKYNADHVVRLTGDCPLADPAIIKQTIEKHLFIDADYTSNCFPPTYPDGLDVEVVKFSVLEEAWKCAELPSEREHVMPYIRNNPEFFSICNVQHNKDLSKNRWTVDELEDFVFVEQIYKELYPRNKNFNMNDILKLLEKKPHLKEINYQIMRNEGALKSYKEDKKFRS
jgi:spore coat polysaccharide biosynthesis protein SpsF